MVVVPHSVLVSLPNHLLNLVVIQLVKVIYIYYCECDLVVMWDPFKSFNFKTAQRQPTTFIVLLYQYHCITTT